MKKITYKLEIKCG